jgi:site-specific DNA-methyltransferase (adenine-specific)
VINLYNQDCMEAMAKMPDKAYDLAICDPPYGLDDWNERGINKKTMDKKHMNLKQIQNFEAKAPQKEYFKELFRVSKNQIIWGGNHFLDYLGKTKQIIVWDKKIRGMHFNDCEIAWASGIKEACRIFTQSANDINRIHPTQKPVALYKWLLTNYAKQGDKILDTHLGSGSIAIACHDLGFDLDGYEIDLEYYTAAVKRLENHQKQLSIFDGDNHPSTSHLPKYDKGGKDKGDYQGDLLL